MLPFWAGVIAALYCIFRSVTGSGNAELEAQKTVVACLPLLLGANMLLLAKHAICMPTWPKRLGYFAFVAVITALYAFIVMYISYILAMLLVLVAVVMGVFGGKSRGFRGSSRSSSSGSSDCPNDVVVVNDGSFWGKTLHRQDNYGNWSDGCGHVYTETCTGFEKKY